MKLQWMVSAVLMAMLAGCSDQKPAPPAGAATNATSTGNPLTAPVDYLGAAAKAQKSAVKVVDTVSINQALQLFNAQEERFPTDLNELVTKKYMPSLPAPPSGMKYDYDAKAGTVRVIKQ